MYRLLREPGTQIRRGGRKGEGRKEMGGRGREGRKGKGGEEREGRG